MSHPHGGGDTRQARGDPLQGARALPALHTSRGHAGDGKDASNPSAPCPCRLSDCRRSDVREAPRARGRFAECPIDVPPTSASCPASVAQSPRVGPRTESRKRACARHAGTRRGASRRRGRLRMSACPPGWISPNWPAPPGVRVVTTTRSGGASRPPYASLNLSAGAGDTPAAVALNRARLRSLLGLEHEPCWLEQVHGSVVVRAAPYDRAPRADASIGEAGSPPCAVLTADCLPVVLCDMSGTRIGIAHAGWRGLANEVIVSCADCMDRPGRELLAWLGPAIGPESYEVGSEVRDTCLAAVPGARPAFVPSPARTGRWLADLYAIATCQLESIGVRRIYGGGFCTFGDVSRFFSHRRDGITGRFATLAWIHDSSRNSHDGRGQPDIARMA